QAARFYGRLLFMGGRVLSFRKKRKNQRKVDWLLSRKQTWLRFFMGLYTGSYINFLRRLSRPEPAAFAFIHVCGSRKL
ncbi:MAG: hypothetical protein MR418_08035, partial [Clostridiales bacterium]|nr:hypothetical protein [Clostridiales bacterium]